MKTGSNTSATTAVESLMSDNYPKSSFHSRESTETKMGDWIQADPDDIMSMFATKSRTSLRKKSHNFTGLNELKFNPSPKMTMDFDAGFCSKENLDQCITYLNQELSNLGFPSMFHQDTDTFNIVVMVNNLNEMLKLHRRTVRQKETLETRQQRSDSDVSHLQQSASHLKETISQLEKDRNSALEKERQIVNKNVGLASKLKAEKDEVKRLKSVMQHHEAQFKHELKKKERETHRLKERIHSLISDKNQERRFTMEISHPLQRSDGRRGKWRTNDNKHEEEMYSLIINSYEEKVQSFMVENHQLRECLIQLQHELKSALKSNPCSPSSSKHHSTTRDISEVSSIHQEQEQDQEDVHSVSSHGSGDLSEGHFQMPYEIVGEGIERSLRQKCRLLKAKIRSKENKDKPSPNESENSSPESQQHQLLGEPEREKLELEQKQIAELEEKLAKYKGIIDQQETIIKTLSQPTSVEAGRNVYLNDSDLVEEKRSLDKERKLFKEQRANFDDERRKFTDAAIRLGLERKAFEENRANQLTTEFMQMTPFRVKKVKSKPADPSSSHAQGETEKSEVPRLVPSTPCFSPAPKRGASVVQTPSTSELYRSIGLVSQQDKDKNRSRAESEPIVALTCSRSTLPSNSTPPGPLTSSIRQPGNLANMCHRNSASLPGTNSSLLGTNQSLPSNRDSSARHGEHLEYVKQALFQQRRHSASDTRISLMTSDKSK